MADNIQKKVIRDDLGRKIKTDHYTPAGVLDYTNAYFFEGDSKTPSEAVQTFFDSKGNPIRVIENTISKDGAHFVKTADKWYDKNGEIFLASQYDVETQNKIKEKKFYRDKNGFRCYHRKHFDLKTGAETLNQDMVCLGIGDVAITPEVKAILERYNMHYSVPSTQAKEAKKELPKAAIYAAAQGRRA